MNEFRAKNEKLLASDIMTTNGSAVTTTSNLGFTVTENQRSLHKIPQKPVKIRNAILGGHDWTVQPPDIKIDGVSGFELDYLKNLVQKQNPYGKKSGELAIVPDVNRLRKAIGRSPKDHSKIFRETLENNTSALLSAQDESEERSLLRHRSISSLLRNQARTENVSKLQSRRQSSKLRELIKKSTDLAKKSSRYSRENKARSVLTNYSNNNKNDDLTRSSFHPFTQIQVKEGDHLDKVQTTMSH